VVRKTFIAVWLGLWLGGPPAICAGQEDPEADPAVTESEEPVEEEHAEEHSPMDTIFRVFNFVLLFGGLAYLLRAPAAAFFAARRQEIQGGLARARSSQADAVARLAGIEGRLARLTTETESIRAEAEASARTEKGRILRDTKHEADRALAQSRAEADRLARGIDRDVRRDIAARVVERAQAELGRRMSDEARAHAIRRAVNQL